MLRIKTQWRNGFKSFVRLFNPFSKEEEEAGKEKVIKRASSEGDVLQHLSDEWSVN